MKRGLFSRKSLRSIHLFAAGAVAAHIGVAASGCAATTLDVPRMEPAEINMSKFRRVAVWGIGGEDGPVMSDELTAALVGSNYFEVKNQAELQKIVKANESQQMLSGMVDPSMLAEMGKVLPEAGMVTGKVTGRSWNEKVVKSEGVELNPATGQNKKIYIYGRTGTATMSAVLNVTDVTSGKILAAKNLKAEQTIQSDRIKADVPLTDAEIARSLAPLDSSPAFAADRESMIGTFMKAIAPHQVIDAVVMYRGDGFFQGSTDPAFVSGLGYARAGQWKEAATAFAEAADKLASAKEKDPQMIARAWYNNGISLVYGGDFDGGIASLDKAYKTEPDDVIAEAKNKAKTLKEKARKLQEQMGTQAVEELLQRVRAQHLFSLLS